MSNKKFSRGSEWRKWDLHFHSPSSHDYLDKSLTDQELINGLINIGVEAVAISDHHKIDVQKVKSLQSIGKDKVLILPAIEFRSELGGSELMHYIGIFSENSDIDYIWKQLQVRCKIDDADIKKRGGYEKTFCDFKETAALIHNLGGLVMVHAGKKSNSLERLKNDIKDDLEVNKCIDILEIGNQIDQDSYYKIVFPNINRVIPIVLCSDNHNIKNYTTKQNLWIKADLTFEGLKQIKYEPLRAYIGEAPPQNKDKNRLIDSIKISKSNGWFEVINIPLNEDLCCIIGGKGSGKTALTDLIALAGGDIGDKIENEESFIGKAFNELYGTEINLKWKGGIESKFIIGQDNVYDLEKDVQYLSQGFVEKICSDDLKGEELVKEIEKIIFDNLDETEKRNYSDFNGLKEAKTNIIFKKKNVIQNNITQLNQDIYDLEKEIQSLSEKEKKKEILEKEKKGIEKQKKEITYSTEEETKLQAKLDLLKQSRDKTITQIAEVKKKEEKVKEVLGKIDIFEGQLKSFFEEMRPDLIEIGIPENQFQIFQISVNPVSKSILNEKQISFHAKIKDLTGDKNSDTPSINTLAYYEKEILNLEKQSTLEKGKKDKLAGFQKRIKEIDIDLANLKTEIDTINNVKIQALKNKYESRWEFYNSFFDTLSEEDQLLKELYKPIQDRVASSKKQDEKLLGFEVKKEIDIENFKAKLIAIIHRKKLGKYQEASEEFIITDLKKFCNAIIICSTPIQRKELLENFIKSFENENYKIEDQLRSEYTNKNFFDCIFSTEEFQLKYSINFNGTDLDHLTPGTKGIALLILYLGINENEYRPLIIDQPEENLDSRSIYTLLKDYFRNAKLRRQIIMITHNPNLVVNTDADQVIVANFDRELKNQVAKICYLSGSLENTMKFDSSIKNILESQGIREHTCEILEGGVKAFEERERKYSIKKDPLGR